MCETTYVRGSPKVYKLGILTRPILYVREFPISEVGTLVGRCVRPNRQTSRFLIAQKTVLNLIVTRKYFIRLLQVDFQRCGLVFDEGASG